MDWVEYLVFGLTLIISLLIGLYYGFFGSKDRTTKEYLLANRKMGAFPVAVSLICSALSAVTVLGTPAEIYLFGTQVWVKIFAYIPFTLSLCYLYLPVYFNLGVNSAYQYIEMRFNAKVRLLVSVIAVVHLIVLMAVAVYASSLAINQVTRIDTRIITATLFSICIVYSSLGGLKAVLWADVFQAFVMLAALVIVLIKGLVDLGGFGVLYERANQAQRIELFNFDVDPRTRYTLWTCLLGGYFTLLPTYAASQLQVQRFMSMSKLSTARVALILNGIGLAVVMTLCSFIGLIIFAFYWDCDPLSVKKVAKADQLFAFFVIEIAQGIPGLTGLALAGITSASLSTLSSGLSTLTSIVTYDYMSKLFPLMTDRKRWRFSKLNCFILGLISYAFVFVVENLGNILPTANSLMGVLAGPVLGLFTLGMFFPWANAKGTVIGLLVSVAMMISFITGNKLSASGKLLPDQRLPVSTDGCSNSTVPPFSQTWMPTWKERDDSALIQLLSISYMWHQPMGSILSVFFGLCFSLVINMIDGVQQVNSSYISPPLLVLWGRLLPRQCRSCLTDPPLSNANLGKSFLKSDDSIEENTRF